MTVVNTTVVIMALEAQQNRPKLPWLKHQKTTEIVIGKKHSK
jgi:hypothetical protein